MWRSLLGSRSRCMTLSGNFLCFCLCLFCCVGLELGLAGSFIGSELCDENDNWMP
jgi:hypothetical protein